MGSRSAGSPRPIRAGGVVSPGGVGFDISCGVRLLSASLDRDEVTPVLGTLMDELAAAVPRGAARGGIWHLSGPGQMQDVLRTRRRARWA